MVVRILLLVLGILIGSVGGYYAATNHIVGQCDTYRHFMSEDNADYFCTRTSLWPV